MRRTEMETFSINGVEYETEPASFEWFPKFVMDLAAHYGWTVLTDTSDDWCDAVFIRGDKTLYVKFAQSIGDENVLLGEKRRWLADVALQDGDVRFWGWRHFQNGDIQKTLMS